MSPNEFEEKMLRLEMVSQIIIFLSNKLSTNQKILYFILLMPNINLNKIYLMKTIQDKF